MDDQYQKSKERRRKIAEAFSDQIDKKAAHRIRVRREPDQTIWFGLGVFGVVGWSVAIPTLIGVAIGLWIDATWPSRFSWALMMLIAGVILGCMNAWFWVKRAGLYRIEPDEDEDEKGPSEP
ncbi:MAG: AtpZ/AtpI family protein [Deltaproteobacteria bacterium]|nr:AtpZ/AtpI family protein [Deltaproteobacteria bacterium]